MNYLLSRVTALGLVLSVPAFGNCIQDLMALTLSQYITGQQGITLAPGNLIDALPFKNYSHIQRLDDVVITVKSREEVERLAEALIRGGFDQGVRERLAAKLVGTPLEKPSFLQNIGLGGLFGSEKAVSISMKDILPPHLREITGTWPEGPCGANCYNAVLQWHFPETKRATLTNETMEQMLDDKFDIIQPGEELKLGDVIVIRDSSRENYLLHTAIYLDDNLVWEKASPDGYDGWNFFTWEQSLAHYSRGIPDGRVVVQFMRKKGTK